jgi:pimeloyl-ACP methyl ester carboxylesterase
MPQDTNETAPNQFAESGGIRFAYRRFGRRGGTPLLLLNYFAANLDKWDPKVTNGFAAERDVILLDYPGIGGSSGETPSTVAALTRSCVEFCRALDLTRFDVLGFSLGGMIAQQLAADHSETVRRIILSGTGPLGGEGMVFEDLSADELDDEANLIMNAFFTQSEPSKAAGWAFIERTKLRVENRDAPVSKQAALAEAAAIREWGVIPQTDRFDPPSDAGCAWEQGRRHHAGQCVPSRSAYPRCSAHHVPGREPRCLFAVCRKLPGKCEAVSQWVRRGAAWVAVQGDQGSPRFAMVKIRRASVGPSEMIPTWSVM